MKARTQVRFPALILALGIAAGGAANAQTSSAPSKQDTSAGQSSWSPYSSQGYIGASVGRTDYGSSACFGLFSCDDKATGFKLYTGRKFSRYFGMELGYVNLGEASRNGGDIKAQGANLSLLGNIPIGDSFNIFAKVGGIYGWTKTTTLIAGVPAGKDDGLGLSYGAGVQYDINKTVGLRADWDRYRLKFVGGRDDADLYSVGLVLKF